MTAYERLQFARAKGRPTTASFIWNIVDDFFELHGDRLYADDAAVIGGVGRFMGIPVTVIGLEKGTDTPDKVKRHFGSAHPEGYRKALRLMKQAEKFKRPVLCFVDTSGAFCGIGAEERGQGSAIAHNLMAMMGLRTPIISVVIGEGGSGGALALAVADRVFMLENAVYSVLSPEGAASIIWKDASKVEEASSALRMTAQDLLEFEIIERIIEEQGEDYASVYIALQAALQEELFALTALDTETLLQNRYEKFRKIGRMDA